MFLRSIRWRLQLWHGLLLVVVLAGFGFTAWHFERANQLKRVDQELQHRVPVVVNMMRRGPDDGRGPRGLPRERPPERDPAFDGPPPDRPPGPRRPDPALGDMPGPRREFRLVGREKDMFEGTGTNGFYYVLWNREGEVVARSETAPADLGRAPTDPGSQETQTRGDFRELSHRLPPGECILIGRNIRHELAEMRRFAWLLTGVGGAVLGLGLVGGWWASTRALRPIHDISGTASKISTGDLSQRIPVADTDNELGQLAQVLNATFAQLESAFRQQARFTSDAAHELRTPVSVMLTQTQAMLARERSPEEYRETLAACQRAAQRMRRLTESLLELARLDAGQEAIQRQDFDLGKTAAECIEMVEPLAAKKGITVHRELPITRSLGDAERTAQVITNLLTNAIHYNNVGGAVWVRTETENGLTRVAVRDNGQGIAKEDLPHIFERFWRADKSRSGAEGRTGLGLSIARSIMEAQGGRLEVVSKIGEGSTFTAILPGEINELVNQ